VNARSWKIWASLTATGVAIAIAAGYWLLVLAPLFHDKALATEWQRLSALAPDETPSDASVIRFPVGVVVRADNNWSNHAFVAYRSAQDQPNRGSMDVLVLDDHYRSHDPEYARDGGIAGTIGDQSVLCRVPLMAAAAHQDIDPKVIGFIHRNCR
jgi:hypothetical protein